MLIPRIAIGSSGNAMTVPPGPRRPPYETLPDTTRRPSAGCGGGGSDSADVASYCEVNREIDAASRELGAEVDPATASTDEIAQAFTEFLDQNAALIDETLRVAPEEIKDDIELDLDAVREVAETGDLSVVNQPDVIAANEHVRDFEEANC